MAAPRVFAKALELLRSAEGEIDATWIQHRAKLDKKRAFNAITIAAAKGLITRTGYGKYRAASKAGAA